MTPPSPFPSPPLSLSQYKQASITPCIFVLWMVEITGWLKVNINPLIRTLCLSHVSAHTNQLFNGRACRAKILGNLWKFFIYLSCHMQSMECSIALITVTGKSNGFIFEMVFVYKNSMLYSNKSHKSIYKAASFQRTWWRHPRRYSAIHENLKAMHIYCKLLINTEVEWWIAEVRKSPSRSIA